MTWAAVDHKQQVVWGIGDTRTEALDDAHREAAGKQEDCRPTRLSYARLSPEADLTCSGEYLYQFIITEPSPEQGVLL